MLAGREFISVEDDKLYAEPLLVLAHVEEQFLITASDETHPKGLAE